MGSSQSIAAEGTVAVVIVAGVLAAGYTFSSPGASEKAKEVVAANSKKAKKKVKLVAAEVVAAVEPVVAQQPSVVQFPSVIPGGFDSDLGASTSSAKKPKKKKSKAPTPVEPKQPEVAAPQPPAAAPAAVAPILKAPKAKRQTNRSTVSVDTDSSWTRVESKPAGGNTSSVAGTADEQISSATGGLSSALASSDAGTSSDPEAAPAKPVDNKRTLAEKLLPKPRKTGVDDMLEKSDYPEIARVMRVAPRTDEKPVAGYSWGDYEDAPVHPDASSTTGDDADKEDDGLWDVVKPKGRAKLPLSASNSSMKASSSSMASSGDLTKKQRQNAQRRDANKAAKDVGEAERLATLARHKKELEKAKIAEQFSGKGGKVKSGGMTSSVGSNGKLVWE